MSVDKSGVCFAQKYYSTANREPIGLARMQLKASRTFLYEDPRV